MTAISISVVDAIAKLEENRAIAVELDRRAMAAHRKAEAKYLADLKAELAALARRVRAMTYDEVKSAFPYDSRFTAGLPSFPSCPRPIEMDLDQELRALRATGSKRLRVDQSSNARLHRMLTLTLEVKTYETC
jgi:hypothetical protein